MAKGKLKKALTKLKGKAKNIGEHIIAAEKNLAKGVEAAVLLPYAPFMKALVKKKGATPEKKIIPLTKQFIELVVKKEGGNAYEMAYYEVLAAQNLETGESSEHLAEDIASIVKLVVEWIQKARKKKESGQPLTPTEEAALKEADLIAATDKKLKETADESSPAEGAAKDISKSFNMSSLKWVAIAVIAFFVIKKLA